RRPGRRSTGADRQQAARRLRAVRPGAGRRGRRGVRPGQARGGRSAAHRGRHRADDRRRVADRLPARRPAGAGREGGRRRTDGVEGGLVASQDWFEKDFYAVLGVSKDVSESELKKVYRKLARQYHPDSNPGDAADESRFKEISEAYAVHSDPQERAEYDQLRATGSGARITPGGAGASADVVTDIFGV